MGQQTTIVCNNNVSNGLLLPVYTGDISTMGVLPNIIVVDGILNIDSNYNIDGTTIYLTQGSEIQLSGGTTNHPRLLTLEKSTLKSCSHIHPLWKGIKVDNNEKVTLINSTIMDAEIGLYSENGGDFD